MTFLYPVERVQARHLHTCTERIAALVEPVGTSFVNEQRSPVVGFWDTDQVSMNKQQKLRNIAEGLLAGLAAVGYQGPWRWAHHEWEGAFYRAWRQWPPSGNRDVFREFGVGGSADGRTSQARDILFTVKSTSPFSGYDRKPINHQPMGLTPEEYLDIWVKGASPQEWMALATRFLAEMAARRS